MKRNQLLSLFVVIAMMSFVPAVLAEESKAEEAPQAAEEIAPEITEEAVPQIAEGTVSELVEETALPELPPAVDPALEARKAAEVQDQNTWDQPEPKIEVSKWGQEIRIVVTPDPKMKKEKILAIQSVKLENEKGEFLGLKTYTPQETTRVAEFMLSPELLKIDKVKMIISSALNGDWVSLVSLEVKEKAPETEATPVAPETAVNQAASTPEVPAAPVVKPKKKGWGW